MSSISQLLLRPPEHAASPLPPVRAAEVVTDLVHDLRQPLSAIEAIAYYLEMTLPVEQLDARQQLFRVQQLVAQSSDILAEAVRTARSA